MCFMIPFSPVSIQILPTLLFPHTLITESSRLQNDPDHTVIQNTEWSKKRMIQEQNDLDHRMIQEKNEQQSEPTAE